MIPPLPLFTVGYRLAMGSGYRMVEELVYRFLLAAGRGCRYW